jgi:2-oxo-3-(phosphooxy)propyl 3-oxoalkanoate synthase
MEDPDRHAIRRVRAADDTGTAVRASSDGQARELSFEATVPRGLVHKRAVEEVLITDAGPDGHGGYLCAGHLPRTHRVYSPGGVGYYDLLLLLELVRQATIVVGHRQLEVPAGRQFVLNDVELEITDLAATAIGRAPAQAVVAVAARNQRYVEGILAAYDVGGVVCVDGAAAARGTGRCMCLPPEDYGALRDAAPEAAVGGGADEPPSPVEAVEPTRVGRADRRDVVVGDVEQTSSGGATSQVVVDTGHPSFFDHELDHVPGMLVLEACRQTAVVAASAALGVPARALVPTRWGARFLRFAELGARLTCVAGVETRSPTSAAASVSVAVEQRSSRVCEATLDLSHERRR